MPDPNTARSARLVIIGAVAAGTSAAVKARRNDETREIVVYERDQDISYSSCGLPYYIGGQVEDVELLRPRNAAWFAERYRVDVRTRHEVIGVDHASRTLSVRDLAAGATFTDTYDELVLATGAHAIVPELPGTDLPGVFTLRNVRDAMAIHAWLEAKPCDRAVVLGSGFIALEVTWQLVERGLSLAVVEVSPQVLTSFDADMAARVEESLTTHGVNVRVGASVRTITGTDAVTGVVLDNDEELQAGLVILAVGVRPNVELARQIGAELGQSGAIRVDPSMRTSVPGVYAVGDCAESFSVITGEPMWRPMGSTANKMGRIAGDVVTGGTLAHRGILGTSIRQIFENTVAQTGFTESQARAQGFDVVVVHNVNPAYATYLGGHPIVIKAIADRASGRLLGAQIFGKEGVDKRIDVLATAISFGATTDDLFHLDLAFNPLFSTSKDPVHYTGMALDTAIGGRSPLITPAELDARVAAGEKIQIIDVRTSQDYARSHLPNALHVPLRELRSRLTELDATVPTVTYGNSGVSGKAAQNVLLALGLADVRNLSGGNDNWQASVRHFRSQPPAPEGPSGPRP